MKKKMRAFFSVLFTVVMLLNVIPVYAAATEATDAAPMEAAADETAADTTATDETATDTEATDTAIPTSFTAFMMYQSEKGGWSIFEAKEGVNAVPFVGDGVYEITLKGADIGATGRAEVPQVFLIDIPDFALAMRDAGVNFQNYSDATGAHDASKHALPTDLTIDLQVYVDGEKVRCKNELLNYGDIEEKGTFRIEIYNIWGLHAAAITENPPVLADAISPESEIKVVFTIQGTGFNTEAGAAQIEAAKPTPTTAPVVTETTDQTDTSSTDTTNNSTADKAEDAGGFNTGLIIGIAAIAVVIAVVVIVMVSKKKKK